MNYDPYSGYQIKFERRDPTGRWSPLRDEIPDPWWMAVLGGAAMGVALAFVVYLWAVQ